MLVFTLCFDSGLARKWLEEKHYRGQRDIRRDHVEFLAEEMRRGRFAQGTPIRYCTLRNEDYLVDGRHRLSAVVASQTSQIFTVICDVVQTEQEIAEIYSALDIGRKRTISDMYSAMNLPEQLALSKSQLNCVGSAVGFIHSGFTRSRTISLHRDELLRMIDEYSDSARQYYADVFGVPVELRAAYQRSSTLSLAMITYRYSAETYGEAVKKFWLGVLFDDGVPVGDVRKVANRHLMTTTMHGGGLTSMGKSRFTPAFSFRYLATCFNCYVLGQQRSFLHQPDPLAPVKILGTPFRGGE